MKPGAAALKHSGWDQVAIAASDDLQHPGPTQPMRKWPGKLSVFLNQPAISYGDGSYSFKYINLADFFGSCGDVCREVEIGLPLLRSDGDSDAESVTFPVNVKLFGFPYYRDHSDLMGRIASLLPSAARAAWAFVSRAELVGAVAPGIFANLIAAAAILQRKPVFFLIRGNKYRTLAGIYGRTPRGLFMRAAMLSYSWFTELLIRFGAPAFVFGQKLYEERVGAARRIQVLAPVLDPMFVSSKPRDANGEAFRILYVGRLSNEKGVYHLVEALSLLSQKNDSRWTATFVGDGPEYDRLKALVARLGLVNKVQFAGHVPHNLQLGRYFENADVFVLPSLTEGVPHAMLEAMGMGLPVIATEVGGVPGVLKHGTNGLLIAAKDTVALAESIAMLRSDCNLSANLAAAGSQTALEYTFEAQARIMTDTLIRWFPQAFARAKTPPL